MAEWLGRLGYTTAVSSDPAFKQIAASAETIAQSLNAINGASLDGWGGATAVLQAGRAIATLITQLRTYAQDPSRAAYASMLADEIVAEMLSIYLRRRQALAFRLASALQLVQARESPRRSRDRAGRRHHSAEPARARPIQFRGARATRLGSGEGTAARRIYPTGWRPAPMRGRPARASFQIS